MTDDAGAGRPGQGGRRADEDLESLPTRELHDRALRRAERHLDMRFLWRLLQAIPAAETVSGDEGEAEYDSQSVKGLIYDAVHSGDGALGEALRPLFIDYIRTHPDA
jgi:hypothetical protein